MLGLWVGFAAGVPLVGQSLPERSVVRIVNHQQRGDWYSPWNAPAPTEGWGSGFVLEGGLVMTNAHVVSDSRLTYIYLHNDPRPHLARVHAIGHDCDLALLALDDPAVLESIEVLRLGSLPAPRSVVETYGYPQGGKRMSSTRGVVSRIEMQVYAHRSTASHLTIQTDAAINPGNSGGPVVQSGKVVGVAFQGTADLENVGFFIPAPVITHFLTDVNDGEYAGFPSLGVEVTNLENPAARRRAGMTTDQTGVRVAWVDHRGSASGHLRGGDVLLSIAGTPIANDGTVAFGALRLDHRVLVDQHQVGGEVALDVLRDGNALSVSVPLRRPPFGQTLGFAYDRMPRYYIYGGLIFVPLEYQLIAAFGPGAVYQTDLLHELFIRPSLDPSWDKEQAVVLLRRLDHPVNAAMAWHSNMIVERANGRPIRSLDDLIAALEANTQEFQVLEFASHNRFGVLRRAEADAAGPEILARYGIAKDRR